MNRTGASSGDVLPDGEIARLDELQSVIDALVARRRDTRKRNVMPTTTIFFDLDDTLIHQSPWYRAAFLDICRRAHASCDVDVDRLSEAVRRHTALMWPEAPCAEYTTGIGMGPPEALWADLAEDGAPDALADWADGYRRESWRRALADLGVLDVELAEELAQSRPEAPSMPDLLFPEVEQVLTDLRPDYGLGLVTNGAPAIQRRKVVSAGLASHMDVIVVAGEVGLGKPAAPIFHRALEQASATPGSSVMVGDRLDADVLGAQGMGIFSVWINRDGREDGGILPDAQIADLRQLRAVLDRRT